MNRLGISPVDGMLTKEQAETLRKDHWFAALVSTGKDSDTPDENIDQNLQPEKPLEPVKKPPHKPERVSLAMMLQAYSTNYDAARAEYGGKWVAFSGRVDSVDIDGQNFIAVIIPDERDFHGTVVCRFVSNQARNLAVLPRNKSIDFSGFVSSVEISSGNCAVTLSNSGILNEEESKPELKDEAIVRSEVPATGSRVYTDTGKEYILGSIVGEPGGEGTVYEIVGLPGWVAKIYNNKHCTTITRAKIKLMVKDRLNYNGIRFPLNVLNTGRGEFTGFVMERAKGRTLGSLFIPQSEFEKNFPGWKKKDIVELAISILKRIQYLHDHDVLMGDINPNNIMFVSPDEVYFIDTDSYQFGNYPCRVGTEDYIAPELQGQDLGKVMRTIGNENFAVATLLFRILMNGKQPYAHRGSTQSAADISAGIFPYGAGKRTVPEGTTIQPVGLWRYIWSHLTFDLKNAFLDTFRNDGRNNEESTRFPVSKWLEMMYAYNTALPEMAANDPMSAEVFPTRPKYRTCSVCHKTKPEKLFYDDTDICRACHEKTRTEIYDSLECIDCGREFDITNGEREYYESKGLELPKRCPKCRELKARKNQR